MSIPAYGKAGVQITCACPEEYISALSAAGLAVYDYQKIDDFTAAFSIPIRQYGWLKATAQSAGVQIKLLSTPATIRSLHRLLHRPFLMIGILSYLLCLFLPGRVFFLEVEGNHTVPSKLILETAAECGLHFGAATRSVHSDGIKQFLISKLPQLEWASVRIHGCTAEIQVREKEPEQNTLPNLPGVCHIIAGQDGIITSCTVTAGSSLVRPGQAVLKNQVLISGYTDCGICIRAEAAAGEVWAKTIRTAHLTALSECRQQIFSGQTTTRYSLLIGKKRIKLWFGSRIWEDSCDRIYKQIPIPLPGGFSLPIYLIRETCIYADPIPSELPETVTQEALQETAVQQLNGHMVAGSVLSKTETLHRSSGALHLAGTYHCEEMISRILWEQIGEDYGKSD